MTVSAHATTAGDANLRAESAVFESRFPVPTATLERVAAAVLDAARTGGATSADPVHFRIDIAMP